ncbi:uncharacterized protein DSM5745_07888 [Aspergillus mulundensis]|uniref:Nucleoside phosphorylase domain-containing protein n=1 Tax=Aspergillus mulundensis TaxID=1810919 RepID=A0A3D8RFH9_9EURO|nr:hypothetical protein DSM5745_07888 [Aspergillus mulundensis]RDW72716.1 hypothetical protein DSM5745_07888 [Aspergillus mulundensis]
MASVNLKTHLTHNDYTVAVICPLELDLTAVRYMLDEEHPQLPVPAQSRDRTAYILGRLGPHNLVITTLPTGPAEINTAAAAAVNITRAFPAVELRLLVGIAGGVPSKQHDIRLGDVVVSAPAGTSGGVVCYDLGQETTDGFEMKGHLAPVPVPWTSMMPVMQSTHRKHSNRVAEYISLMLHRHPELSRVYRQPPGATDVLFASEYHHVGEGAPCTGCNKRHIVSRAHRAPKSQIFYGIVASGNRVIRNGVVRDSIARDAGGALCIDMQAAVVMKAFECVVIRGIANYCDSHASDEWNAYAAAAAAAVAKEMLTYFGPIEPRVKFHTQELVRTTSREAAYAESSRTMIDTRIFMNPICGQIVASQGDSASEGLIALPKPQAGAHSEYQLLTALRLPVPESSFLGAMKLMDILHDTCEMITGLTLRLPPFFQQLHRQVPLITQLFPHGASTRDPRPEGTRKLCLA